MSKDTERAIASIVAERCRQITEEGWTPAHDDAAHYTGDLPLAAACYALTASGYGVTPKSVVGKIWPWDCDIKAKDRRRDLLRAAALLVAEIERLDREEECGRGEASMSKEPDGGPLVADDAGGGP